MKYKPILFTVLPVQLSVFYFLEWIETTKATFKQFILLGFKNLVLPEMLQLDQGNTVQAQFQRAIRNLKYLKAGLIPKSAVNKNYFYF